MKRYDDPVDHFKAWFAEAEAKEPGLPEAFALATASASGAPSVRMLLLKGVDERGFVFYTNLDSRKGGEIRDNDRVAMCFYWKSLDRQVRVEGTASPVADAEADAYFATRARTSQIGAWASRQSQPLEGRFELEKEVARYTAKFHVGKVPRPPRWSGYRVRPDRIEFWRQQAFRLHDRLEYRRVEGGWKTRHLFP